MDKVAESDKKMSEGAVTLLDILGWKGIWQRKEDSIATLLGLIKFAREGTEWLYNNPMKIKEVADFSNLTIDIKSISDTIAIVTYGEANLSLEFHAILAQTLITHSILKGIPVRGATSYGHFSIKDNIMVGPAVDEVAAWYEEANWIGVILTPSAYFKVNIHEFQVKSFEPLVSYDVPMKKYGKINALCVNWPHFWSRATVKEGQHLQRKDLTETFVKSAPILPDVYLKFTNTLNFYDHYLIKNKVTLDQVAASKEE